MTDLKRLKEIDIDLTSIICDETLSNRDMKKLLKNIRRRLYRTDCVTLEDTYSKVNLLTIITEVLNDIK